MMKVGLIGEGIDKNIFRLYPLNLRKVRLIEGSDSQSTLYGQLLADWVQRDESHDDEVSTEVNAAVLSQLLQRLQSYDDISLSIARVPVFPPESAMLCLAEALEWMTYEVQPDFLHIGFSSPEGKYQKLQNGWLNKLNERGCTVVCPVGIPPAFPASLNHVISVADRGFIDAGFELSDPTTVIEETETVVCLNGAWVKQAISNEVASAIVFSQLVRDELARIPPRTANLVELPRLNDIDWPDFEVSKGEAESGMLTRPNLLQKGRWFLKSLLSRMITPTGKVPAFVKEARRVSCNGDGKVIKPCDFRKASRTEGAFVCGACGCGDRESVFVDGPVPRFEKLDYPYVSCPASMPGFSNYLSSTEESQPSERKQAIEAKFGDETLKKAKEVQERIRQRLDKRLGWLDKL